MKNYLIVIAGPTAIGKTALAVELAIYYGTEVISADSRQFYRELNIGTVKPRPEEMKGVPHHFINNLSITEPYNASAWEKEALALLDKLFLKHQCVILCGGSGLFIDALCYGMDNFEEIDPKVRETINEEYREKGLSWLQHELKKLDPVYFDKADQKNPHRLIRALEVCIGTGKPYSSFRSGQKKERNFNLIKILLNTEREKLYQRINERVDRMMQEGLAEEVEKLLPFRNANALNTVGYKELIAYFDGKISLEESTELIRQNTRRYAKRQLTWFRNDKDYMVFEPADLEKIKAFIDLVISH